VNDAANIPGLWTLAQQAAQPPAPEAAPSSMSLLDYIHSGGTLSYLLVLVSFVAVGLIIRNALLLRRDRLAPPESVARLDDLLREGDITAAREFCNSPVNASFVTRVFGAALARCARSPFGLLELRTSLEEAGGREADRLHRLNDPIGVIAAIGPMIGLLGTVIGMIGAFMTIGTLEGTARSTKLAEFMSLALVCTAEGLIVAIPCTIAFSMFRRKVDALVTDMGELIEDLANRVPQGEQAKPKPVAAPRQAARVGA
jgi:biopolymer transport protein ExbB